MEWIKKFFKEEEGTETVEWAVAGGLIVAVGAAIFGLIGTQSQGLLNTLLTAIGGTAP
jgi:Flp pilus assembly pilin Flp